MSHDAWNASVSDPITAISTAAGTAYSGGVALLAAAEGNLANTLAGILAAIVVPVVVPAVTTWIRTHSREAALAAAARASRDEADRLATELARALAEAATHRGDLLRLIEVYRAEHGTLAVPSVVAAAPFSPIPPPPKSGE